MLYEVITYATETKVFGRWGLLLIVFQRLDFFQYLLLAGGDVSSQLLYRSSSRGVDVLTG